jgi:hypothetical protein
MKYIFYSSIVSILLLCSSCKTPELIKTKEITYKTGFAHRGISGVFFNKEDKTEYVYFGAFGQPKKLSFFTVFDGETPKIEIPLDSVLDWRTVEGIAIKNLDTIILVNSSHVYTARDRLTFMDREGRRWKNLHLDEMIPADENRFKYFYFLMSFDIPLNFLDNDIVFLNSNKSYREGDSVPKDNIEYMRYAIPSIRLSNIIMKFNINTHQYQQVLSNMWDIECPDTNLYIRGFQFSLENNILFVFSYTGNKLYLLDKETLEINKEIEIKSPHTSIGNAPCSLEDRIMSMDKNYGRLQWITYDKYNKLYYVAFTHEIKDAGEIYIDFEDEASFSIQIYNKRFKQLAEQVFDGKKYNPKRCILTSKGMLIGHSSATNDYSPYEIKYDLYEFKK